jgi:rubrerythrin
MAKWKCSAYGYVHEGEFPPENCYGCGAPKSKIVKIED